MMALRQPFCAAMALSAWAGAWTAASLALADTDFVVQNADPPGVGFNDPTPVQPVGGNAGSTLGQQRLNAVRHAADVWGELIDSPVPIVVEARFSGLGCGQDGTAELARARPFGAAVGLDAAGADPEVYYPAALANSLAGEDLFEGSPEIVAQFNGDLDRPECIPEFQWYYGLDGDCGSNADLITATLHELAHGLGVIHLVDLETGALFEGLNDHFSIRVFDNSLGKHWSDMSDAERAYSATNVRQVVWDGAHVTAQAPKYLASGAPRLQVDPEPPGFEGLVAEANFGALVSSAPLEAELALGSPRNGCDPLADVSDRIALLFEGGCSVASMARFAYEAGAAGLLIAGRDPWDAPPASLEVADELYELLDLQEIDIPCLAVTTADALLLERALADQSIAVTMTFDPERLVGADATGKVFLNATRPALVGTSIGHWDALARPNLLMEPLNRYDASHHHIDLTWALLQDIGWTPSCGNGQLDMQEECDDGPLNSDVAPDACRTDCMKAYCGDGVVDTGERCDQGQDNSDDAHDACRTDCKWASSDDATSDAGQRSDAGMCCDLADAQGPADCDARCGSAPLDADGSVLDSGDRGAGSSRDGAVGPSPDGAVSVSDGHDGCGCRVAGGRAPPGPALLLLVPFWICASARRRLKANCPMRSWGPKRKP